MNLKFLKKHKLSKKNKEFLLSITRSLTVVLFVLALTGTITWSAWSDEETSESNTITTGTLDLQIGGSDLDGSAKITLSDAYPGMAETAAIDSYINNAGSIDISSGVTFSVSSVQDDENGLLEPEQDAGDTIADGELCGELEIKVLSDMDDSNVLGDDVGDIIYDWGSVSGLATAGAQSLGNLNTVSGAIPSRLFKIEYRVPSTAGSDIMSDTCSFDMNFTANQ